MAVVEDATVERSVRVDAPAEVVFALYTDAERMTRWMGVAAELDARPGGVYRVAIHDGHVERGEFVEVVPFSRIVHTYGWEGEASPIPPGSTLVTIDLVEDGDGTLVRVRHTGLPVHGPAVARGWEHYLARLAVVARGGDPGRDPWANDQEGNMERTMTGHVVERELRIDASAETVFGFLVEPERMCRWMGVHVEAEARPGGSYRVNVDGTHVAVGEFVEVVPNRRVVFTWGWEGEGAIVEPGGSTVEFTLTPDGDGTLLRLVHRLDTADQARAHADGWDHYLPRLQVVAAGGDPHPDEWATNGGGEGERS